MMTTKAMTTTSTKVMTTTSTKVTTMMTTATYHDHAHEDHGGPIEWAGAFTLDVGNYVWSFAKVDGAYADPAMKMLALPASGKHPIESTEVQAAKLFKKGGHKTWPQAGNSPVWWCTN